MAVAQPKICSNYQRDRFEHAGAAGGFIDSYGFPFCRGRMLHVLEKDHGQYDDLRDIFWASGAAFFIKQPYWERSEEHTSELQSLMRISYAVFCLKKKKQYIATTHYAHQHIQHIIIRHKIIS